MILLFKCVRSYKKYWILFSCCFLVLFFLKRDEWWDFYCLVDQQEVGKKYTNTSRSIKHVIFKKWRASVNNAEHHIISLLLSEQHRHTSSIILSLTSHTFPSFIYIYPRATSATIIIINNGRQWTAAAAAAAAAILNRCKKGDRDWFIRFWTPGNQNSHHACTRPRARRLTRQNYTIIDDFLIKIEESCRSRSALPSTIQMVWNMKKEKQQL